MVRVHLCPPRRSLSQKSLASVILEVMDFERTYQELFVPLYRYVFIRVKNYDTANDIVQTVFTRVFEKYSDKSPEELTKILYQSAKHELIDQGRRKQIETHDPADYVMTQYPDYTATADLLTEKHERRELVETLMSQLSTDEQEVIRLRYFHEKEYGVIAELMGKTEPAIRKMVSRSIKKMNQHYEAKNKSYE